MDKKNLYTGVVDEWKSNILVKNLRKTVQVI